MFGRYLLGLFGPGFVVAYVPLLILLLGEWLSTCAGSVGFLLTMTRFQKQAPIIFLCGVISSLILAVLLVPKMGFDRDGGIDGCGVDSVESCFVGLRS